MSQLITAEQVGPAARSLSPTGLVPARLVSSGLVSSGLVSAAKGEHPRDEAACEPGLAHHYGVRPC
jgi:hypothetical protein